LAVYAVGVGWEQRAFAATAQLSFASQAILALALRGLPHPDWRVLVALVAAGGGLLVGHAMRTRVRTLTVRRVVVALAMAGSLVIVLRGLVAW
jgi:uncharacterized membrane protein YfcA